MFHATHPSSSSSSSSRSSQQQQQQQQKMMMHANSRTNNINNNNARSNMSLSSQMNLNANVNTHHQQQQPQQQQQFRGMNPNDPYNNPSMLYAHTHPQQSASAAQTHTQTTTTQPSRLEDSLLLAHTATNKVYTPNGITHFALSEFWSVCIHPRTHMLIQCIAAECVMTASSSFASADAHTQQHAHTGSSPTQSRTSRSSGYRLVDHSINLSEGQLRDIAVNSRYVNQVQCCVFASMYAVCMTKVPCCSHEAEELQNPFPDELFRSYFQV
jgi:hypothetical protein